ncbi:MAG: exonuclease SbcCD subunit D [Clostridia bacterium]|nr:exonuclease SbcCD subunit D [Clostridia bacterium]
MKLLHLADLHIGKRVNEFPMIEDQQFILGQILSIIEEEKTDGVILAGDIYDKSVPSAEAVKLFDDFLVRMTELGQTVFMISGNHDSAERIAFGGRLMENSHVYVSPVYNGHVKAVPFTKDGVTVSIYLLPFVKPAQVRPFFEEMEIGDYTDAMSACIQEMHVNPEETNILVTHQFVTGASRCDSEELSVGGTDNVDAEVFDAFDYVALGHLHGPQHIYRETIRYAGSPLKYSFSERNQVKSVTVLEIEGKGRISVLTRALTAKHDLREIRGSYADVTFRDNYLGTNTDDYVHIILTDETDVPDALAKLRVIYPNLMRLEYDNTRTRTSNAILAEEAQAEKSEIDLLDELYELQNGVHLSDGQRQYAQSLFESIREEMQ